MKPVKPKKMPKSLHTHLERCAENKSIGAMLPPRDVRAILAALEYERQQREKIAAIIREMFDERVLDPYPTSDGSYEYQLREMVGWSRDK